MHPKKKLASRDRLGCVYECACGTIHLSVGPVDLKFSPEGLLETYEMLGEAVEQLKQRMAKAGPLELLRVNASLRHTN
jgi:hypothetical protein